MPGLHSTGSDYWHRESERRGLEQDRLELRERCEAPPPLVPPAEPFIHPDFAGPSPGSSYELFAAHMRQTHERTWRTLYTTRNPGDGAPNDNLQEPDIYDLESD